MSSTCAWLTNAFRPATELVFRVVFGIVPLGVNCVKCVITNFGSVRGTLLFPSLNNNKSVRD